MLGCAVVFDMFCLLPFLQETLKKWPEYAKLACKESAREFLGRQKKI